MIILEPWRSQIYDSEASPSKYEPNSKSLYKRESAHLELCMIIIKLRHIQV